MHQLAPPAIDGNGNNNSTRMEAKIPSRRSKRLAIRELLKPHIPSLLLGLLAVAGEGAANLLEPWPLKIVLDNVLRSQQSHAAIMRHIQRFVGTDKLAMLKFACFAVVAIAALDAICTYGEKYLTTSVGQWVTYDLRRTLYSHIQKLSLAFHDQKRTGDLISRVTSDIDAIQSFITQGLLGVLINIITLLGMVAVMFYLNWRFTLIALSVAPMLFAIVYSYTRRIKKASRAVRKKEGEEGVEVALRARGLKAKLTPIVNLIVATGTCLVLWF